MTRKTIIALAVSALATLAWASSASAAKPRHKAANPPAQADQIAGVNPMTNAPPAPPVEHPATFQHIQGVNPM